MQHLSGEDCSVTDKKMKGWFMKEQKPLILLFPYSSLVLWASFHSQLGVDLFDAIYIII